MHCNPKKNQGFFFQGTTFLETMADNISALKISQDPYTRAIERLVRIRDAPFEYLSRHSNYGKILFSLVFFVLYNAYLIGCIGKRIFKFSFSPLDGVHTEPKQV